jgi:hypothetical protein
MTKRIFEIEIGKPDKNGVECLTIKAKDYTHLFISKEAQIPFTSLQGILESLREAIERDLMINGQEKRRNKREKK